MNNIMKLEKINLALKLPIDWLFSLTKKKKKSLFLVQIHRWEVFLAFLFLCKGSQKHG